MEEFVKSEYLPESGWELAEFVAAQEATKHWVDTLKKEFTNGVLKTS